MPKATAKRASHAIGKRKRAALERAVPVGRLVSVSHREKRQFQTGDARFDAVMKAAERCGLLSKKSSRIGGRVSPTLVEQAKKQTGIESDTDLIAFALANIALEDRFAKVFKQSRGKADADLKLGF